MRLRAPVRKRLAQLTEGFGGSFEAAVLQLFEKFLKSNRFKSATAKGAERQAAVWHFVEEYLPSRFSLCHGEVVDQHGHHSPALDIMIYDKSENFPFHSGDYIILPAEALLASIEIKSELSRDEIHKSVVAAGRLKALKPFKLQVAQPRADGEAADDRVHYFHCIFSYTTDLSSNLLVGDRFLHLRCEVSSRTGHWTCPQYRTRSPEWSLMKSGKNRCRLLAEVARNHKEGRALLGDHGGR
jgi:hypothetical protein